MKTDARISRRRFLTASTRVAGLTVAIGIAPQFIRPGRAFAADKLADGMIGGPTGFEGAERYQYGAETPEGRAVEAAKALKAKGVSGNYYYSDIPFTAEYGAKYLGISLPFASFLLQAATGRLPAVSYIDPAFLGEGQGVSRDDHPLADIRNGQAFLNQIYDAVRNSPKYDSTLLVITYDEWGGFADHVAPGFAPISADEAKLGNDGRLGFRVPTVIIGPRARRGHVDHTHFDHTSILNMIVWRFGLTPFYTRANSSNNLAVALDFDGAADTTAAPAFDVPGGPFGEPCSLSSLLPGGASLAQVDAVARTRAAHLLEMQMLKNKALRFGYQVY
mgnify:CR=1 FL=1